MKIVFINSFGKPGHRTGHHEVVTEDMDAAIAEIQDVMNRGDNKCHTLLVEKTKGEAAVPVSDVQTLRETPEATVYVIPRMAGG